MMLEAIISEKTMQNAKEGKYTFRVSRNLNKFQIRKLIEESFGVHVVDIKTMNVKGEIKKTLYGRKKVIKPQKKAIVTLKEKEKIDLFEEGKNQK